MRISLLALVLVGVVACDKASTSLPAAKNDMKARPADKTAPRPTITPAPPSPTPMPYPNTVAPQ